MYYTFYKNRTIQIINLTTRHYTQNYNDTITIDTTNISLIQRTKAAEKEQLLNTFWDNLPENIKTLVQTNNSMQEHYYTFRIPKKTHGFREINAPNDTLKEIQTNITKLFQNKLQILTHNAAFAYVPKRSIVDALKQHQKNYSKWFLKLDIKDFFPSCTKNLVYQNLIQLYPCALFTDTGKQNLKNIIHLCCLNDALPQGSPASPYLSNIIFTKYDYQIHEKLYKEEPHQQHFVYTRYADDILISARQNFNWQEYQNIIQNILGDTFKLKTEKTRYGSIAGRNWNLGLMLNKDNKITTGHVNKQLLKAKLHHFIIAYKEEQYYTIPETQHLQGILNYAKQIEPDYINYIINHYSEKFNLNILDAIKYCLKRSR